MMFLVVLLMNIASNLCNYLKDGGKLLILFPVMGSLLSITITIQEVVKSDRWQQLLNQYSGSRVTYAVATRPTLSFLNLNSPIYHREENKDTMSNHETPSSTSYGA
jgi:hypothetical protein